MYVKVKPGKERSKNPSSVLRLTVVMVHTPGKGRLAVSAALSLSLLPLPELESRLT
jgi:hypothetical protein